MVQVIPELNACLRLAWAFKDRKEGKGAMNWVERRERYTGDWKQDLQCGYGEHVWIEERCDAREG